MNKKAVSITSLVAGILTAVVALFFAIAGIMELTKLSSQLDAKFNIFYVLASVLDFALAAFLGILSYFIIRDYLKNAEGKKWVLYASGVYFLYEIVGLLLFMCIFTAFDSARNWVILVFAVAGCVVALLSVMGTFKGYTAKILAFVPFVIGFILSVILLVNAGGFSIAVDLFLLFTFVSYFLYYLFDLIVAGAFNQTNTNKEVEDTKTAEEETKTEE